MYIRTYSHPLLTNSWNITTTTTLLTIAIINLKKVFKRICDVGWMIDDDVECIQERSCRSGKKINEKNQTGPRRMIRGTSHCADAVITTIIKITLYNIIFLYMEETNIIIIIIKTRQ